ncbi:MAG: glycosyltransferase family 9 protein, partial [bacterium]
RYTVMVDGRLNNPSIFTSTPHLMYVGRARFRVGARGDRKPRIYNVSVPEWNGVDHYIDGCKHLVSPFSVNPATLDWQPEIFLTQEETARAEERWSEASGLVSSHKYEGGDAATSGNDPMSTGPQSRGKRLLVNLSASEPNRRWPDGKFIATLQHARSRYPGMPMIVMGLPSEWSSVEKVANAVRALPVQTPNLRDAFALVGTADLVFTPDTSISHAASAFRKPTLVLLKRGHKPYAPYNTPGETVAWNENEIQQLPYERVSSALDKLLTRFAG